MHLNPIAICNFASGCIEGMPEAMSALLLRHAYLKTRPSSVSASYLTSALQRKCRQFGGKRVYLYT